MRRPVCRVDRCWSPVHQDETIAATGLCFKHYSARQTRHKPWAGAEDRLVDAGLGMRRAEVQ